MTPRRVLHLLSTAQYDGAGITRMVRTFAQAVDPARYQLSAWFLGGDGPLASQLSAVGMPTRTFSWNADRRDVAGAWEFWRSLRQEQYSIVHMHFGGRAVPLLVRAARRTNILLHLHASGAEAGNVGPLVVRTWAADGVVVISSAIARIVSGIAPHVVRYGIDTPVDADGVRRTNPRQTLGTAGRLVPIKGIVYLIRAFAVLRHEFPDIHLEIAGTGPEEAALQREVNALGVARSVTFLGWQRDMQPALARWDIFVQPSLDEGLGMAVLEAMAACLPVIASSAGGLPELVVDGETGYVVAPADPGALAARLRELLRDVPRRWAMGAAGRARVQRDFSTDRMAAELMALYDRLLSRDGDRA